MGVEIDTDGNIVLDRDEDIVDYLTGLICYRKRRVNDGKKDRGTR